jgi:hypothetical protein
MTAITWREPAVREPAMRTRGAHRRPAEPRPRKRLLSPWRRWARKTGHTLSVAGGGITVAGAATDFLLVALVGLALIGLAIFVGVKW